MNNEKKFKIFEKFSFNMILNLANVCNAESPDVLWGFIENYYGRVERSEFPFVEKLLEYGVQYYNKFVLQKIQMFFMLIHNFFYLV